MESDISGIRTTESKPHKKFDFTIVGILLIGLAIGAVVTFALSNLGGTATITGDVAATKALGFINDNLLSAQNLTAELEDVNETNDMYLVNFQIIQGNQSLQPGSIYVTKDGKSMIIGQIIDLNAPLPGAEDTAAGNDTEAEKPAQTTANKTDKPEIQMFVMSYCPFGKQAEDGLFPVVELLGDKIKLVPHFVVYEKYCGGQDCTEESYNNYCLGNGSYCSMHGLSEIKEDLRQMIVYKYYPDKFWAYVNSINANTTSKTVEEKWEAIAKEVGLDASEIKSKMDSEGTTLLAAEAALNKELKVSGSPTIFINGVKYSGGRAPEDFKKAICGAFSTAPEECSQALGNATAATSGGCGAA